VAAAIVPSWLGTRRTRQGYSSQRQGNHTTPGQAGYAHGSYRSISLGGSAGSAGSSADGAIVRWDLSRLAQ
jgi:hypothetical protein